MIFMSKKIDEKVCISLINHVLCKMCFECRTINIIEAYIQAHIFKKHGKHIFNIISLSYESLRDQGNYVQQLSKDNHILSI